MMTLVSDDPSGVSALAIARVEWRDSECIWLRGCDGGMRVRSYLGMRVRRYTVLVCIQVPHYLHETNSGVELQHEGVAIDETARLAAIQGLGHSFLKVGRRPL